MCRIYNRLVHALPACLLILASLLLLVSCRGDFNSEQAPAQHPEANEQLSQNALVDQDEDINSAAPPPDPKNEEQDLEEEEYLFRVAIYEGRGSWKDSVNAYKNFFIHYDIDYSSFDEKEAVTIDFIEQFEAIVFPGGFAAEYKNFIADHDNIRNFIEKGGLFIGSCAGAYYASDILRWKGTDYEYPLKLFKGRAIGPLSGHLNWGESGTFELNREHPANKNFAPTLDFHYFDGPYFEAYEEYASFETLATYKVNKEPAIIAGRYGEGKYLLFGPHPELGRSRDNSSINIEGEKGANWPWLYSSLTWLLNW